MEQWATYQPSKYQWTHLWVPKAKVGHVISLRKNQERSWSFPLLPSNPCRSGFWQPTLRTAACLDGFERFSDVEHKTVGDNHVLTRGWDCVDETFTLGWWYQDFLSGRASKQTLWYYFLAVWIHKFCSSMFQRTCCLKWLIFQLVFIVLAPVQGGDRNAPAIDSFTTICSTGLPVTTLWPSTMAIENPL